MINLLSFLPKITDKKSKRRGRGLGSNKGAKSGRGTTRHQKARQSIPLHFEGGQGRMVKKFPLLRGKGRNKSLKKKPIVIALEQLNKFQNGDTVTVAQLIQKKIIKEADKARGVKILNKGKLEKKIILKVPASKIVKKIVADMNS
jgi:large subunit ribosomal protein L15